MQLVQLIESAPTFLLRTDELGKLPMDRTRAQEFPRSLQVIIDGRVFETRSP